MNEVSITVSDLPDPPWLEAVEGFLQRLLENLGLDDREVSLLFCSDRVIRDLNLRYRGVDEATDVLSFPQELDGAAAFPRPAGKRAAGDVAVSLQSLEANAQAAGVPLEEELKRLLIHGLLHLEGMDHEEGGPRGEMLRLQESLVREFHEERLF